ncbi:MAG: GNAT family N-acetyltransferase [Chloroflexi bacterium]|nr:GNAT family N-acetyltransferase [Chloroflexota bacterium]
MTETDLPALIGDMGFRAFTSDDLPAAVALHARILPEHAQDVTDVVHREATWDSARFWRKRVVGFRPDGHVIAVGTIEHLPWQFHPHRYVVRVMVDPDHRGVGIGSSIHAWILLQATHRTAWSLRCEVQEADATAVRFVARRGYAEAQRNWESRLDVASFDVDRFATAEGRVTDAGIKLTSLAHELERVGVAGREGVLRAVHDVDCEGSRDEPSLDPVSPAPFERWVSEVVEAPDALPDAFFLAVDDGRYVGLSAMMQRRATPGVLGQGFTAVVKSHRGRGIAIALKVRTVAYARANGYREIVTWNNSRNRPMLRINEAMGFAKKPVWIEYTLQLREPEDVQPGSTVDPSAAGPLR